MVSHNQSTRPRPHIENPKEWTFTPDFNQRATTRKEWRFSQVEFQSVGGNAIPKNRRRCVDMGVNRWKLNINTTSSSSRSTTSNVTHTVRAHSISPSSNSPGSVPQQRQTSMNQFWINKDGHSMRNNVGGTCGINIEDSASSNSHMSHVNNNTNEHIIIPTCNNESPTSLYDSMFKLLYGDDYLVLHRHQARQRKRDLRRRNSRRSITINDLIIR